MRVYLSSLLLVMLLLCAPLRAAQQRASYTITQGRIANPAPTLRVPQGDTLVLALSSDAPLEVHLHGYDVPLTLKPGVPGQLKLVAHSLGRFPLAPHGKGHHHGPALLYLEVVPR